MSLKRKISKGITLIKKSLYQKLFLRNCNIDKPILLIMACHRSGTSIVLSAFDKDKTSKTFGEFGILNIQTGPETLRLKALDKVKEILNKYRNDYFVLKPLAEIPNALNLLNAFPKSYIIWIYRDYKDVSSSNLKQFGKRNGIDDLRPIVEKDQKNWRSFGASENTVSLISNHFSNEMDELDAAAWFWYSRNISFIEQDLHNHQRVIIIKYEDLVKDPESSFIAICAKANINYKPSLISDIHARAVGKGKSIALSETVNNHCRELYQKLEEAYFNQAHTKNN
jgi:hypothetical protein